MLLDTKVEELKKEKDERSKKELTKHQSQICLFTFTQPNFSWLKHGRRSYF